MLRASADSRAESSARPVVMAESGVPTDLEPWVASVELRLVTLADALRERDVQSVELQAHELHQALAKAVEHFMRTARHGGVPEPMRLRLARASGQLARQRDGLARATAALDRAIDVLMPGAAPAGKVYAANGLSVPMHCGGSLNA